jgi:hypothetical protein
MNIRTKREYEPIFDGGRGAIIPPGAAENAC